MIPQVEMLQLLDSAERDLRQLRWQRAHDLRQFQAHRAPRARRLHGRSALRSLHAIVGRLVPQSAGR